jgi:hypothetical protein
MNSSTIVHGEAEEELRLPTREASPIDDDDDDEADFDDDEDDESIARTPWGRWIAHAGFSSSRWWLS